MAYESEGSFLHKDYLLLILISILTSLILILLLFFVIITIIITIIIIIIIITKSHSNSQVFSIYPFLQTTFCLVFLTI